MKGVAGAQFNLGVMYARGDGVEKDPAEATRWYRKAAEQGHAEAQFNLGLRYYKGEGVRKSRTMALKWFRKAAAQGHPTAKDAVKELSR